MTPSPLLDNTRLPLVLLGGTLCNAALWQPVIQRLNIATVQSVTLTGSRCAPDASRRLLSALPPRFMLAGFSLGAIVALQMLADAPQRIAGVALLSANPLADPAHNARPRREAVHQAASIGLSRWLIANLWPRYVAPHRLDDDELQQVIAQMAEDSGPETFARQTEIAITRRDNRAALTAFPGPALIINGVHDVICTPHHHQLLAQSAPSATWKTIADSGHFLPLEAPDTVADTLRHWLTESMQCVKTD
ncbi:alpha/beta fold hydrolase [Erwinia sp. CPCC 100877]|nr:alpha/beta fold hydrolase [Erwinia sp. CPCC 100877]